MSDRIAAVNSTEAQTVGIPPGPFCLDSTPPRSAVTTVGTTVESKIGIKRRTGAPCQWHVTNRSVCISDSVVLIAAATAAAAAAAIL